MTQASTLVDYANGVPDELTLGSIVWYSVADPQITYEEMVTVATTAGIDLDLLPNRVAPSDAFRRACKEVDRKDKKPLPWNGTGKHYTFMVRHIVDNATEVERHLVFETIDKNGRKLGHEDVGILLFDKKASTIKWSNLVDSVAYPTLAALVEDQHTALEKAYQHNVKHIDPQGIRHAVRQQLGLLQAIQVRPRGGVYFVPVSESEGVEALKRFLGAFGNESAFHALPLMDTTDQRGMIQNTFETSVHEESLALISELRKVKNTKKKLTKNQWQKYRTRFNELSRATSAYSDLVSDELDRAKTELTALHTNIMDILEKDLIK